MCDCTFTPYPPGDHDFGEESWHYLRTCLHCGGQWFSLHCPHDGNQNPCPKCNRTPTPVLQVPLPEAFIEKYASNPAVVILFGAGTVTACRKDDLSEIEQIEFSGADAIAMQLLRAQVESALNITIPKGTSA